MKTQLLKIFTTVLAIVLLSGCYGDEVYLGEVQVQNFDQEAFSKVSLETLGKVNLHESTEYRIEIQTNLALFDNFTIEVINDELVVRSEFSNREQRAITTININIYAPTYTGIEMGGVGDLTLRDGIQGEHLDLRLDGVGKMDIRDVDFNSVKVIQHGVGSILVTGLTESAEYIMHATGEIATFHLDAKIVEATVNGIGDIELSASDELDVRIKGIGSIYYKGNPTIQQSINGIGKLINAN